MIILNRLAIEEAPVPSCEVLEKKNWYCALMQHGLSEPSPLVSKYGLLKTRHSFSSDSIWKQRTPSSIIILLFSVRKCADSTVSNTDTDSTRKKMLNMLFSFRGRRETLNLLEIIYFTDFVCFVLGITDM